MSRKRPILIQTAEPRRDDPRARFLIEMARALGTYGVAAHRLEEAIQDAAARLGIRAQIFSTPTSVFVSTELKGKRETMLSRVDPRGPDLSKIVALDEILRRVAEHSMTPARGTRMLKRIVRRPPAYGPSWHILAAAIASAGVSRFFGGGVREIVSAGLIGVAVGFLGTVASRQRHAARLLEFLAGAIAAVLASVATTIAGPISIELTMIAGLIALMPGMSITTAMAELATRNLVSGTARFVGAITIVLSIGFGVAAGQALAVHLPGGQDAHAVVLPVWTEVLAACLAPFAFLILFNARPRDAVVLIPAGILSFVFSRMATGAMGPEFGVCATAAVIGIAGNLYARWRDRPAQVIILPGLLMMVPGSLSFRSFESFLSNDTLGGTQAAFRVLVIAVALVVGLLLANVAAAPRRSL